MKLLVMLLLLARGGDPNAPVQAFLTALGNGDVDALVATLDDDATIFMPMASMPLRLEGKPAIRTAFEGLFKGMRPFTLTPRDMQTRMLGSDTALVTFHLGTPHASEAYNLSRRTFVVVRRNGHWVIAHLHASNVTVQPEKTP